MTERHAGYVVTLDHSIREDDAECGVLNALRMVKGVVSVVPVEDDVPTQLGYERARQDLRTRLLEVLR